MKKLLAVLLAALMLASVTACSPELEGSDISAVQIEREEIDKHFTVETGTFTYEYIDSASVRVVAYDGMIELHDLVIPAVMNDKAVVEIADDAFDYCSNLRSVTVPASVKVIGKNAFAFCGKLAYAYIPASLSTLGSSAFAFCDSLEKVVFTNPESAALKTISSSAFHGCVSLAEINLPATVTEIGTGAFFKCEVLYTIELPASLEKMGTGVFMESGLEAVAFADGIKLAEIPQRAFAETKLIAVSLPDSVTLVNHNAFNNVETLQSVSFGNNEGIRLMSNAF